MKKLILFGLFSMAISLTASAADDELKDKASKFGFQETQARLEAALKEKGLTLFAKIDHADGAQKAGLSMRPATVTIFGNPKGGTPFMVAAPKSAIDFPLKALVWENSDGKVFLSYNTLAYIVRRHNIAGEDALATKLDALLSAIAKTATE